MGEPYIGEIRMFAGGFAPRGYALCDGQLIAVSQNDALFSLLGTIYGGDGRTTFGLPDLRGRIPIHEGQGPGLSDRRLGSKSGTERETLTVNQLPSHDHRLQGIATPADDTQPSEKLFANAAADIYIQGNPNRNMATTAITAVGGGQSHNNIQPFLCINYIIALAGVYPSRT